MANVVAVIAAMCHPHTATCSCGHVMRSATTSGLQLLVDSHQFLGLAHRIVLD